MVRISYHAEEQIKGLSPGERSDLTRVLESGEVLEGSDEQSTPKLVSRFGDNKRVVWKKAGSGDVVVLAIVSR